MPTNKHPDHKLTTWNPLTVNETMTIMSTIHSGAPTDPGPRHTFNLGNQLISTELT